MIPNLPVASNEDTGIEHRTSAEMNRGRKETMDFMVTDEYAIALTRLSNEVIAVGSGWEEHYHAELYDMEFIFCERVDNEDDNSEWCITEAGRAALAEYREGIE